MTKKELHRKQGNDRTAAERERAKRDERSASHERESAERPTGYPTWDRHATETAHSWEDET